MALDTSARRNSALLDACGMVLPDGALVAVDRATLLGQYGTAAAPPPGATSFFQSATGFSGLFGSTSRNSGRFGSTGRSGRFTSTTTE
jgi:hypothetical protein